MLDSSPCSCHSGKIFSECCQPFIVGEKRANTAESLMRSRFTANVFKDVEYLLKSWHPSTRPVSLDKEYIPGWYGLHIVFTEAGLVDDDHGVVEYKARYLSQNKICLLHELSHFVKEDGQWFYVDGDIKDDSFTDSKTQKVGRNESCFCGSGKKFKKCCGPLCE